MSQEYFEEEEIRDLYEDTLARMLGALDDSEDGKSSLWPPWPWPPWGDEDGDDDKKEKKPANKTERAKKLAAKVVAFEQKIGNASLDLYVDVNLQSLMRAQDNSVRTCMAIR